MEQTSNPEAIFIVMRKGRAKMSLSTLTHITSLCNQMKKKIRTPDELFCFIPYEQAAFVVGVFIQNRIGGGVLKSNSYLSPIKFNFPVKEFLPFLDRYQEMRIAVVVVTDREVFETLVKEIKKKFDLKGGIPRNFSQFEEPSLCCDLKEKKIQKV